jgi:hypothetical protein
MLPVQVSVNVNVLSPVIVVSLVPEPVAPLNRPVPLATVHTPTMSVLPDGAARPVRVSVSPFAAVNVSDVSTLKSVRLNLLFPICVALPVPTKLFTKKPLRVTVPETDALNGTAEVPAPAGLANASTGTAIVAATANTAARDFHVLNKLSPSLAKSPLG